MTNVNEPSAKASPPRQTITIREKIIRHNNNNITYQQDQYDPLRDPALDAGCEGCQ